MAGTYYNQAAPPVQYSPVPNEHTPMLSSPQQQGEEYYTGNPGIQGGHFYGYPQPHPQQQPQPQQSYHPQYYSHQYQHPTSPPPPGYYQPLPSAGYSYTPPLPPPQHQHYGTPPPQNYNPQYSSPISSSSSHPVYPTPTQPAPHPHQHSRHRHSPPALLYPILGIFHFTRHLHLWRPFLQRLPKLLILSTIILLFLFTFLYLPQVAILAFFHGPLAWVNAFFIVLNEAATLISLIAEAWLVEDGLVDTFDAVLLDHGLVHLVATARVINSPPPPPHTKKFTSISALGKYTKSPYLRFSPSLTCKFLLCLPLNFVPVVGPVLYILGVGYLQGPLCHYRYFQLKGWGKEESREWIGNFRRGRGWAYLGFGSVHMAMQLVPFLNILLLFTTAVGAGLWSVEIERREREEGEGERERLCHRF